MKKLMVQVIGMLIIFSSCKKQGVNEITDPAPIDFEIIGKDGSSMVKSKRDSVTITYIDNNVTKVFRPSISRLQVSITDTSTASNYNGLFISDNAIMSGLSSRSPNPIYSYSLSLNGVSLGTIYVNYWQYQDAYPQLSSPAFTFNNIPVVEDTKPYFLYGSPLNLLKVQ